MIIRNLKDEEKRKGEISRGGGGGEEETNEETNGETERRLTAGVQ